MTHIFDFAAIVSQDLKRWKVTKNLKSAKNNYKVDK